MRKAGNIPTIERIISPLSYLSAGWIGLIYCVYAYFNKKATSHFLRFNVFQSIIVAVVYFLLYRVLELIFKVLSLIPIVQILVSWLQFIFMREIFFDYSLIQIAVNVLVLYMIVLSAFGYYPWIYKLSNVIDNNAR